MTTETTSRRHPMMVTSPAKGSASPSMTAINTAVTASKATKDARDKGKEIITEFALPEVDRKSERSGAENKDPATKRKRGKAPRRRRTPPLSERPKTLSWDDS